jgi:uncharacterized protein YecE (DUF72 family)
MRRDNAGMSQAPDADDQPGLFDAEPVVGPAVPDAALRKLADDLALNSGGRLHLGTSSWYFPGWAGQVWDRPYPAAALSREGLSAYAAHPLFNTVSLDRGFYRALDANTAGRLAAQARSVSPHFRFVVKAPAALCNALLRDPANGAALEDNPGFLDPALARASLAPLIDGLGEALGVLVFQLSPLPAAWLREPEALHARLAGCWQAIAPLLPGGALLALEVRDAALLTPALAAHLRAFGVRAVLGLHDRLPAIDDQLPLQRALWPGDLVCRWNLQRGQRYAQARDRWAPFDRMQAPDEPTRATLARVVAATLAAGHRAFVTINNKAEGSAPASVRALAALLLDLLR